jgi:hypothetical protein
MELTDDEKHELVAPINLDKPAHPPGLCINLTEREFEKLDLDSSVAEPGGLVHLHAMGEIERVEHEGDSCNVRIKLTHLHIESEDEENEEFDEENEDEE